MWIKLKDNNLLNLNHCEAIDLDNGVNVFRIIYQQKRTGNNVDVFTSKKERDDRFNEIQKLLGV